VLRSSRVVSLSKKIKATPAQVAIAWLLAKSPVMMPIPGTSSLPHLEQNMAAINLKIKEEDLA
jgi:aryl-alcohol dehydrogenase-like predicted oxidoreductase